MAPVLDRCRHTGLTIPECSCADCLRSLVERHAPHVLAASAARPKPAVAEPEAEVGAPRGWVGTLEYWLPPVLLMAAIFALSAQPDLNSGLGTADMIGRKIVHLAEYALLCLLWVRALRTKV
ncbi:MAG: hypothetical protein QOJ57_2612, partial [Thermoleophilaceae bacterium]|nr:hypothetical protein [Thermoleophilaceae bacterium]